MVFLKILVSIKICDNRVAPEGSAPGVQLPTFKTMGVLEILDFIMNIDLEGGLKPTLRGTEG